MTKAEIALSGYGKEDIDMSVRLNKILGYMGLYSIRDIVEADVEEIMKCRNCGIKTVLELLRIQEAIRDA